MPSISAPAPSEEWADDDFDIPDGQPLLRKQSSRQGHFEDWDADLADTLGSSASNPVVIESDKSAMRIIRPTLANISKSDDDEDEGVSTIKVGGTLLQAAPTSTLEDDDFEDAFTFPSEMTQLSLAPLSLHHQSSKSSFEWGGDRDQTTSSQSSDAYSTLGFADASPTSNSTAGSNDTDDSDSNEDMDGIVLPDELFESKQAGRHLSKILAVKKAATEVSGQIRGPRRSTEEDFELGLVIDDDFELSPSRLKQNAQKQKSRHNPRSTSLPIQRSFASLRPPSRLRGERAMAVSPPPVPRPKRSQTFQTLSPASAGPSTILPAKPGSLRGQKSHTGLKPPSPTNRKLSRKASLSSLLEGNQSVSSASSVASSSKSRYEEPTAASRAKVKASMSKASMSKLHHDDYVPPTRPSTPSTSTAALRLTMPTQGARLKSRPPLSSVWGASASPAARTSSPLPPRPPSSLAKSRRPSSASLGPVQQMMRPQKSRVFGDGSELDNIDDLSTDRDKESRFDVHPQNKNRIPGGSYSNLSEKGTLRRKARRDISSPTNSGQ